MVEAFVGLRLQFAVEFAVRRVLENEKDAFVVPEVVVHLQDVRVAEIHCKLGDTQLRLGNPGLLTGKAMFIALVDHSHLRL